MRGDQGRDYPRTLPARSKHVALENAGRIFLTALTQLMIPIETFHTARGSNHPLKYLADFTSLLIAVYVAEATLRAWRCGRRQAALVVGASITVFIVIAGEFEMQLREGNLILEAADYPPPPDQNQALDLGRLKELWSKVPGFEPIPVEKIGMH